jgi:hypothetical protein
MAQLKALKGSEAEAKYHLGQRVARIERSEIRDRMLARPRLSLRSSRATCLETLKARMALIPCATN